ncbi:MAG: tRNA pseudouridine(54/55) synthase Pus10, partial [Halobacteriaceae archaeon]
MIIESARDALETGPLCNSCLGRCFANRSFDLTNSTRGQSLRTTIHLIDDTSYEEPTEPCWVCDGYCDRYGEWAAKVLEELSDIEFQTFQIGTRPPPLIEENEALLHEEIELSEDSSEKFKREFNREVGKRVENELEKEVDFERPDIKILLKLAANEVEISINPAFVYGRYRKFSREIPQTEWPCSECNGTGYIEGDECSICDGSGYRYEESVEQLTTPPVREAMDGDEAIFHGAGREDIDAKMLGSGRPFVIEVKNPRHRKIDVDTLESKINEYAGEKVEVDNLRLATYEMVERVKELSASKTYRIQVEFSNPVEQENFEQAIERLEGATIEQRTPQ